MSEHRREFMTDTTSPFLTEAAQRLRWPLRLTWAGILAERITRSFWPFASLLHTLLSALMLGLQDLLPLEAIWVIAVFGLLGLIATLIHGVRRFHMPRGADAMARLDETMPGRPIAAMTDTQAIGSGDFASEAIWDVHVRRMAERARSARPVRPDLRVSSRDPFALRYVALVAFVTAMIFGSVLRVSSVTEIGNGGQALAAGPAWEGWIEPPAYTGRPSLYLNDITRASVSW